MSADEKDYSEYINHLSNMGNMYSFLSGFMFTAITVLITQLPDPNRMMAQFVLFFMAGILDMFILYMGSFYQKVLYFCKKVPPYSEKKTVFNLLSDISVLLGVGVSTVLLFLLWNLIYLALAQLIALGIASIAAYRSVFKPYYQRQQ
ncbi:MAG: hypothetical protein GWO20_13160 [Candidatus Korarchaeota archaeon]|nr:hypothetical protein [Candidatus Korarchaeota archaeon]